MYYPLLHYGLNPPFSILSSNASTKRSKTSVTARPNDAYTSQSHMLAAPSLRMISQTLTE